MEKPTLAESTRLCKIQRSGAQPVVYIGGICREMGLQVGDYVVVTVKRAPEGNEGAEK